MHDHKCTRPAYVTEVEAWLLLYVLVCMQGFQEQTQHWPVQPIDMAIAWLKKKSCTWVAADFGCGDARLSRNVPQAVHSLDLVASVPGVTACNMAHTPLGELLTLCSELLVLGAILFQGTLYHQIYQTLCL